MSWGNSILVFIFILGLTLDSTGIFLLDDVDSLGIFCFKLSILSLSLVSWVEIDPFFELHDH